MTRLEGWGKRETMGKKHIFTLFCSLFQLAAFCSCVALLTACDMNSGTKDISKHTPGVTHDEILIGSSLVLSGHAEYLGIQTLRGALSYINYINEQGGVFGRKIKVSVLDDAYDPSRCLVNTQKLIVDKQVFALFCYVGTPTTVKILPLVQQAEIPLVGMFTGANALRTPFNKYVINVRPSYYQETAAAVEHLVGELGLKRIAVFYQYDTYGFDGLTGTELALKKYNLAPVARGSYIRGTTNIQDGLNKIIRSNAQAVVMIGTYKPCARFILEARKKNFDPIFYNVSFVGGDELARLLHNDNSAQVILSQVAPSPTLSPHDQGTDGDPGYVELLKRYFPGDSPNSIGLEGFFNAKVLVSGLRKAGYHLTRKKFIHAIESIHSLPLTPKLKASFSDSDHQGLDTVYFTRLVNGTFVTFSDWNAVNTSSLLPIETPASPEKNRLKTENTDAH